MHILTTVLVCFFAGMGAGLGTGFAGMSAAAVISPMLITFLDMDPYLAVGIALSSDVLASAVSAYTYGKNKNLDIRNGLIMMASVLAFTVVGSYIASIVPSATMGSFSVVMTFLLGVKFIVRPVMTTKEAMEGVSPQKRAVQSVVCGVLIGFICGFIGAGGGMMMLLILTSVLGYELKTAVGTSVFIMTFTALTGAVSHFMIGGAPDWGVWVLCVLFTLLWARIAAVFANKATPKTLNRATGVVLVVLGILALIVLITWVNGAERRIPVQYAKRQVGRKMYGGQASTLPMKVNMSGVLPIIFAQSIAMIPSTIAAFCKQPAEGTFWYGFLNAIDTKSVLYMIFYFLMIIAFSYFYATIQFNPVEISNNLKKNGGFIPGFRPGKPTTDFIKKVLNKVTLFGAIYLGVVAILPLLIGKIVGNSSLSIGGTSVIIVVGVALETVQALESQMLMRQYKGFLE